MHITYHTDFTHNNNNTLRIETLHGKLHVTAGGQGVIQSLSHDEAKRQQERVRERDEV